MNNHQQSGNRCRTSEVMEPRDTLIVQARPQGGKGQAGRAVVRTNRSVYTVVLSIAALLVISCASAPAFGQETNVQRTNRSGFAASLSRTKAKIKNVFSGRKAEPASEPPEVTEPLVQQDAVAGPSQATEDRFRAQALAAAQERRNGYGEVVAAAYQRPSDRVAETDTNVLSQLDPNRVAGQRDQGPVAQRPGTTRTARAPQVLYDPQAAYDPQAGMVPRSPYPDAYLRQLEMRMGEPGRSSAVWQQGPSGDARYSPPYPTQSSFPTDPNETRAMGHGQSVPLNGPSGNSNSPSPPAGRHQWQDGTIDPALQDSTSMYPPRQRQPHYAPTPYHQSHSPNQPYFSNDLRAAVPSQQEHAAGHWPAQQFDGSYGYDASVRQAGLVGGQLRDQQLTATEIALQQQQEIASLREENVALIGKIESLKAAAIEHQEAMRLSQLKVDDANRSNAELRQVLASLKVQIEQLQDEKLAIQRQSDKSLREIEARLESVLLATINDATAPPNESASDPNRDRN